MQNINERPICHRAEDLVTYLYSEASPAEARDFSAHMKQCDACRGEFTLFNQVHASIANWRNEALGTATVSLTSPIAPSAASSTSFVQHERKLSAWASLREFFSVSPLWLRGATAFAGLLFCVLLVFAVSRFWQQPVEVVRTGNSEKIYTQQQLENEVQKQVAAAVAARDQQNAASAKNSPVVAKGEQKYLTQPSSIRTRPKTRQPRLTDAERIQLAADLGLIPGRDEELPFVFPEEPNQ